MAKTRKLKKRARTTKKDTAKKGDDKKKRKKGTYKRGSLGDGIRALFDKKGVDKVTYEECLALAKKIMPTTKFNKAHYSWYKNDYSNRQE